MEFSKQGVPWEKLPIDGLRLSHKRKEKAGKESGIEPRTENNQNALFMQKEY